MRSLVWLILSMVIFIAACSSSVGIIGRIPNTQIDCYSVKDRDFFVAGVLLLCTKDGTAVAASGGAAPGAAGFVGSIVQGAGTLGAGLAVGSGIKALESIKVKGQIVPDSVKITPVLPKIPEIPHEIKIDIK